jgi:hypothetical protein
MNFPLFALLLPNDSLNAFFGAGLGAAFYILIRTHRYLVERSFDPKYNNAYLTRFFTGLVAGFILATVTDFLLGTDPGKSTLASITPGVIAILGGFSAEAVEQVLQRMVEILLTAIRGDASVQAKAQATSEKNQAFLDVAESLNDLKVLHPDARSREKVDEILTRLRS